MATKVIEQATVAIANKSNAGKVIELLLKTIAGSYHKELSATVPSVATKVNLRNYENDDDNVRRKYYVDQIYHMVNEVYRDAIETDTVFAGKLDRRLSIEYNKAGLINFHVYHIDESVADMYANIIAMICTMKSTWFMRKLISQPLFRNGTLPNLSGDGSFASTNLPFLNPIIKDQYTNFGVTTRRGGRNVLTPFIFSNSIYSGVLGGSIEAGNGSVTTSVFLNGEYVDLPALKAKAYETANFYGSSGNLEAVARRLMYIQLMFLRLMNGIDHTGNIFAGYQRALDKCNFVRMLSADTLMLPVYDAMMMAYNYATQSNNALASQAGAFDISERKPFLEDIYGWSDAFATPFMTATNNSEWDASIIKMGIPFTPDEAGNINTEREDKLRELAENLQTNLSGLDGMQSNHIFAELMKTSVGAMENKWFLHHKVLGKDYFRYPELPFIASNKPAKSRPFQDHYNPNVFKPSVLMYIAGPDFETNIASRQDTKVTIDQVMAHEQRAVTNYHPSNIISELMNCRDPRDVLGFDISIIPTDVDVQRISKWLREQCKAVFVINDPSQAGLRTAVKTLSGEMGPKLESTRITEAYKAVMAIGINGPRPAATCQYIIDKMKTTLYPFKTINLTKALLASKFKNLQSHCNNIMETEGGRRGR